MQIIVYVKEAVFTTAVRITKDGKLDDSGFAYEMNDWDRYAMEEALQIKESIGGSITAIAVGPKRTDRVLSTCLALGADQAIRIWDKKMVGSDYYAIAKVLSHAIQQMEYDLILTGSHDDEDICGAIAPTMAVMMEIQYSTILTEIDVEGDTAKIKRELEDGLEEVLKVSLPAIFTVQSGINLPRYPSLSGMMKAKKKPLVYMDIKSIGLSEADVGESGSKSAMIELFVPEAEATAEIIEGTPEQAASKTLQLLIDKGVL